MRVAALYDIHGMPWALEAVLAELDADAIVIGGDFLGGPYSAETLERIRSLDAALIRGNVEDADPWGRTLPLSVEIDGVLYCHATPTDVMPGVTARQPEARFRRLFRGTSGTVVIGHTHHQFDRDFGDLRVINAGSVGMAYEGEVAAFWTLMVDGEPTFRKTRFDVQHAIERIEASDWPDAEAFVAENLRQAVGRDEAMAFTEQFAERVRIGRVGKPHGIDGAFFVEQPSSDEEWWKTGSRFLVGEEEMEVVLRRTSSGRPVIRLDRPVERGAWLEVERQFLPPTQEDEYYAFELVGLRVVEENGRELGSVKVVTNGIANDVLELDSGVLLPMIEDCVRLVEVAAGRIVVAEGFTVGD